MADINNPQSAIRNPHSEDSALLRMEQISKSFPGVQALKGVDFEVLPGEVHALVGENGAGKSTLMKALTGAQPADEGRIIWRGETVAVQTPGDAGDLGISMIHQELSVLPYMTVGQNVFLGREPRRSLPGVINWPQLYTQTEKLLKRLNLDINPATEARDLSIAQQQMVEVAKALSIDANLIVMDEPTSSLTEQETDILFSIMRNLKAQGVSIVFISHRLEEVFEICDRVTVLRDGRHIATKPTAELDHNQIVALMVGRELTDMYHYEKTERQDVVLSTSQLSDGQELQEVSFDLYGGEILGIAGLVGAGRTALAETIFGIRRAVSGDIQLAGEVVKISSPQQAIRQGMGFVPEDRKLQGLFLNMAVRENINMSNLGRVSTLGFVNRRNANEVAEEYVEKLDIRTPGIRQEVRNLSGGNQQKVVIARWLTLAPRILILDEPTRGVDVGAKAEIHGLMRQLAAEGVGVIMISSELPEILGVSDRVLVMHEGRVTGEFSREGEAFAEATQEKIMHAATGALNADGNNYGRRNTVEEDLI